jgi:hypothetical protein
VFGQLDGLCDGVDNPTEEDLACGPLSISLSKFAEGDGFRAVCGIGRAVRSEDVIDGLEDGGTNTFPEAWVALR